MTVASLQQYLAHIPDLPDDLFIGSLLFYRVAGCAPTRDYLEQQFNVLGLDPRYLPNPIDPGDAFLKATNKDNWRLTYPMGQAGHKANILIRDIKSDRDRIVKAFVREVVDARAERLHTGTIGECIFYKAPTNQVRLTLDQAALATGETDVLQPALDQLKARFDHFRNHYDAQAVRMMLRDYITDLNAVLVNPTGGLYFVHKTRDTTLDKLDRLMKAIGGDCLFELIPLVNTPDKRDMLLEASQTATEKACKDLLERLEKKREGGRKISVKDFQAFRDEYQTITHRAEEYSQILGVAQDRAAMSLEGVTLALKSLVDKIA